MKQYKISLYSGGGYPRFVNLLFLSIFTILLCLPITLKLVNIDVKWGLINENRNLAVVPTLNDLTLKDFFIKYDEFIKDNMPFRQFFLTSYIYVTENILKSYELEEITGKNNEKFYNTKTNPILEQNLGLYPYSDEAVEWLRLSEAGKYAFFYSKYIPYHLFIIPDKGTLYPEWMPFYSKWIINDGWYNKQIEALNHANIPYYDLKKVLVSKKNKYRMYDVFFDNSHWNGNGLMTVYPVINNILRKNNSNIFDNIEQGKDYSSYEKNVSSGVYGKEKTKFVKLNHMNNIFCGPLPKNLQGRTNRYEKLCVNNDRDGGTLWFFSDSYFGDTHGSEAVTPFVHSAHNYLHSHYNLNPPYTFTNFVYERFMSGFKPDAVISEFVERGWGCGNHALNDFMLRILGDLWLHTGGFLLDTSLNTNELELANAQLLNAEIQNEDATTAFAINALNIDPTITFKHSVTADYLGRAVVMAKYISPADSFAQVFYSTDDSPNISEEKSVSQQIHAGENLVHLTVHVKPFEKVYLRFDPGAVPGQYIFENIPEVEDLRKRMQEDGL